MPGILSKHETWRHTQRRLGTPTIDRRYVLKGCRTVPNRGTWDFTVRIQSNPYHNGRTVMAGTRTRALRPAHTLRPEASGRSSLGTGNPCQILGLRMRVPASSPVWTEAKAWTPTGMPELIAPAR